MNDRISIEEASAEQMRAFGSIVFGLELTGTENKPTMLGKLKSVGYDQDDIPILGAPPVPVPGGAAGGISSPVIKNDKGEDCYKILINIEEKEGGDEPVPVGVNGEFWYVPRGEPVLLPLRFEEALRNAVQFVYDPYTGTGTEGLREPRKVPAYPLSRVA